ncbi:ROK family protein [Paenibacillus cymbidii]|uniref:ROK family protein n=1 Tax=Paenibacillus cymbidii TaxID=1639034 RepID=UPI0010801BC1|nr:ROK family protein [Paenibacillus cymbidii]
MGTVHHIGIDIGGTNIVCGLVSEEGTLIHKIKWPTEAAQGGSHVFDRIAAMIDKLLTEANVSRQSVQAVGIGTPGLVDPERGVTEFAGNLRWTNVPVADEVARRSGFPVFIDNDVRMYVYGEAMRGAARGFRHVLGVTLGTGLAAAIVNDGSLYYGGGNLAGELGHIKLEGIPYECGCGGFGCLETMVSGSGIARQAKAKLLAGEPSLLRDWFPDASYDHLTAADVSRAYDAGDPAAIAVMQTTGRLLGQALSYAVTILSPDVVVIGGGGANAGERIMAPMREELKRLVFVKYWERLVITAAEHNDDAGIFGSAWNARQRLLRKEGN